MKMKESLFSLPLDGIEISRKAALELINRMNKFWPGKYWLEWREPLYSNAMANPYLPQYYAAQASNYFAPKPDPFDQYPRIEGWGIFPN